MSELLLIVRMGGQRVAIPGTYVESVVEIDDVTPVPRAPAHVAGLSALRSRVLTVIDCAASLGLAPADRAGAGDAIVVLSESHAYALLVEAVDDVLEFGGKIQPLRAALDGGWARVAAGTVEAGEDLLLLVDPIAILAGPAAEAA